MNIYRPTFRDRRTGQTRQTPKHYLDFMDHLRRRQRLKAHEDRDATDRLGRLVAELVRCRRLGQTPESGWLSDLERIEQDIQERLVKMDIVKPAWLSSYRNTNTLDAWVDDFQAWLSTSRAKTGYLRNETHIQVTMTRLRNIVKGCRFRQWSDITPARIENYLGGLPIVATTHVGYIVAIKHFCKWCRRNGLVNNDPLADLGRPTAASKDTRRPLAASEVRPLLEATLERRCRSLAGPDRAALYVVGLVTGFRRKELSFLTPASFDLDRAVVRLDGAHTKDHRDAVQPIPISLLDGLRAYLTGKDPKVRLWHPLTDHAADMIRTDAKAAGLTIEDQEGRKLCFHSLRHSLRSWLVRAKVVEAVIDDILRHKPPTGSTGRRYYTHLDDADRRAAIESLPSIPWPADLVQIKPDIRTRQTSLL